MRLSSLTYLILELNAAIDTGLYQDISLEEVKDHIESRDLFPWLKKRLGKDIDLSLLDDGRGQEIAEHLEQIRGGYAGNERRKWGIEHSGLCLLLAWVNELVQQREWTDDR